MSPAHVEVYTRRARDPQHGTISIGVIEKHLSLSGELTKAAVFQQLPSRGP